MDAMEVKMEMESENKKVVISEIGVWCVRGGIVVDREVQCGYDERSLVKAIYNTMKSRVEYKTEESWLRAASHLMDGLFLLWVNKND